MSSHRPKTPYSSLSGSASSSYSASDSDLSSSSSRASVRHSMDSSQRPVQVSIIRCLRCARAEELTSTDHPNSSGMVQIGTNIYYCNRCAKMVGYT
ncbi:hypothetical protein B0T21DRAFT_384283 [Apiosordaria backusii]|uniref:Uncharacterized protein n=1 Tax=Apiosordaria backusii TaxID=314023 RepID=A0AA40EH30_9PEZI|nr:hypothetical protein B0T21DRAFT_384283 [Apiosordaria backusii]